MSAVRRLMKRSNDDTSLAKEIGAEPRGGRGEHSREVKAEGELLGKNGKRGRPVGKGRKEDKAKVKS